MILLSVLVFLFVLSDACDYFFTLPGWSATKTPVNNETSDVKKITFFVSEKIKEF